MSIKKTIFAFGLVSILTAGLCLADDSGNSFNLTVTVIGPGTITSSPAGISCAQQSGNCTGTFSSGAAVTLAPKEDGQAVFQGWSSPTGSATQCAAVGGPCSFVISADSSVTATFVPQVAATVKLSVMINDPLLGMVISTPAGIACGAGKSNCTASFSPGERVSLTFTITDPAVQFSKWTNGTQSAITCNNNINNCQLTLDKDSSITATFIRK